MDIVSRVLKNEDLELGIKAVVKRMLQLEPGDGVRAARRGE